MGKSGEPEILKRCRKIAFPPSGAGTSPNSKTVSAEDLSPIPAPTCPSPRTRLAGAVKSSSLKRRNH